MRLSVCLTVVSVFVFSPRVAATAQQTPDLLWRARALQAMDKIEESVAEMNAPSARVTRKQKYETMLEFAFAQVIVNPDIVVKKSAQGVSYHLLLNYGDDGLLDTLYTYDAKSSECLSFSCDSLPKHRRMMFLRQSPGVVAVANPNDQNEPVIMFHRDNPFLSYVGDPPTGQRTAKSTAEQTESPPLPALPEGFVLEEPNRALKPYGGRILEDPNRNGEEARERSQSRTPESLTAFLKEGRIGSSPDFAIEQQSMFEPARWDHVITVHGFVSDFVTAQQLVRYLSETSNDRRYRAVQLNK